MRFVSAVLVVCVGIACDTIPLPSSNVPVNSCAGTGKGPCPQDSNQPARQCESGGCTVTPAGIFTLVVHVPSNNFSNPGLTFALSPEEIASVPPPVGGCGQEDIGCLTLPAAHSVAGTLVLDDPNVAATYFTSLGSGARSVPGLVTFEPLWRSETGGALTSAGQLGIPLADTQATQDQNSPFPGPNTAGDAFQALLQDTFVVGLVGYRMTLQPSPPFDSAFPPLLFGPELGAAVGVTVPVDPKSNWTAGGLNLDGFVVDDKGRPILPTPPITSLFPFNSLPGAPSLAGFRAKIVRWPSGALLSNIITMSGDPSETHTFVTLVDLSAENAALVVDPPAGSVGVPSIVQAFVNGVTQAPQVPKLFDPVTVEGTVTRNDPITGEDVGTQASLVFDVGSAPSDMSNILAVDEPNPTQYFLTYRTSTRTDANGNYTVVLPPTQSPTFKGHYEVWITPDDPALATTNAQGGLTVGISPAVQKGKSLGVNARTHLTGQVVTFDGRPMPGAMIVAEPSPSRFDPKSIATDYQTASLGWPRETMTSTDDTGNYDLLVEPGLIDLAVRPAAGSHYPWTVLRNHLVDTNDANLDVTIPAPMHMHLVLTDDRNNPIPFALVSAYLSDGKAYRLVGQTTTLLPNTKSNPPVPSGSFELYLPPSFP